VQRDLRRHRQTHPVAADQKSGSHQGDLVGPTERGAAVVRVR
jgi:hypothetical protein